MTLPEGRKAITPKDLAKLAGHPSTWEAEIEILNAKLAKAQARQPKVKPLRWLDVSATKISEYLGQAHSSCGEYSIQQDFFPEEYFTARFMKKKLPGVFGTVDEAKAACQADYVRKIMDALEWPGADDTEESE